MTSVMTNGSALSALKIMRDVDSDANDARSQVSSGLRVRTASDDAAYWSISTAMRSEKSSVSAVSDSIAVGQAILDTAYSGMDHVLNYLNDAKDLIVMAANEGEAQTNGVPLDWQDDETYDKSSLGKIDRQLRGLFDAMKTVVDSSSFNGVNLLKIQQSGGNIAGSIDFVSGISGNEIQTTKLNLKDTVMINYNRNGDYFTTEPGAAGQGFLDGKYNFVWYDLPITWYNSGSSKVLENADKYVLRYGIQSYASNAAYRSQPLSYYYENLLTELDGRISSIANGMAVVGAVQRSMSTSAELTKVRMNVIAKSIGRLVDANIEEQSSRLKALEARQQLSAQALSIANAAPQSLLKLFQ